MLRKTLKILYNFFLFIFPFAGIFFVLLNVFYFYGNFERSLEDVFFNRDKNLPSRFGEDIRYDLILPLMKKIPEDAALYLWAPPFLEKEIANECAAYELAYHIYPAKVFYRDDRNISVSDFVVCEKAFSSQIETRLFELGLLFGRGFKFEKLYEDEKILILGNNKKFLLKK